MKNRIFTLLMLLVVTLTAAAKAQKALEIKVATADIVQIPYADITKMFFRNDSVIVETAYGEYRLHNNEVQAFGYTSVDKPLKVSVNYTDDGAVITNPLAHRGVSSTKDGAYVKLTSAITGEEIEVALSGESSNGGFAYKGDYKMTLSLNGLNLTSKQGGAVEVKCSKRIAVVVADGTVNTLIDSETGDQKAALYFSGHPEFEGAGTLNVTGNSKHAISTKEYLQLKKKFGTLNILSAANDGIHAGQYFQMNGGVVTIRNVGDDGIQAEATNNPEDEQNGQMIIKGGTLDIQCDADGVIVETSNAPAYAPGGWPGGGGGGWPGGWDKEDKETSCVSCLKSDSLFTITGGTLNLKATGKGGKCIKVDNGMIVGTVGADGPTINATTTGTVVTGSGDNINGQPKAIKVYGNLDINSGFINASTKNNGGEGIECKSYLTFNGGTTVCDTYDDGINAAAKITFNDGIIYSRSTGNDGIDCNGREGFEFNGGVILSCGTRSPEEGFDCDNNSFAINGGTLIGVGGATSNPTKATQPFKTQSNQSVTANTYLSLQKTDGTVICSYRVPNTLSGATVLVSSPEFQSGTSYKLVRNTAAPTSPTATYLDGAFTVGGTISGGTSTTFTPTTR